MTLTDAQIGFYQTIKNYHRAGYSSEYILAKIVSYIGGEVVSNINSSADYTIYLDGCPLFTGTYSQLLDDLFQYIFDNREEVENTVIEDNILRGIENSVDEEESWLHHYLTK